ncbi:hypothetical protein [Listeria sp. ILCC797]|uniref:hypothetical protein n=1 Tax=Listeria sp. ILCC797 TaxID=1918333 RepID=UPI000B592133|nr:hypothetical protein [Listeria sp. ILCC797]
MGMFDKIYQNAYGYRNDMIELNNLVQQLSNEKGKGDPVVSWFRLRDRRVKDVVEPMREEMKIRIKRIQGNLNEQEEVENDLEKAKTKVWENDLASAKKAMLNYDVYLSNSHGEAEAQINELLKKHKKNVLKLESEMEQYKNCVNYTERAQNILTSARKTKEIDHATFSEAIKNINDWKRKLDIDVPEMKELPESYNDEDISNLHAQIREVVARLDARYKMGIFASPMRTVRIIIHDVGNDRGKKAFANRSRELISNCNESINIFNGKYWQITGLRWQHIEFDGACDYVPVTPTHAKIPNI